MSRNDRQSRTRRWVARLVVFSAVAALLTGIAAAGGGGVSDLWSDDGAPAERAAAIGDELTALGADDPENAPLDHVDITKARTVGNAGGFDIVALPAKTDGYCLTASGDDRAYVGMVCTDTDDESTVVVWSSASSGGQALFAAGRVVDARAAVASVAGIDAAVSKEGFFTIDVPAQRWEDVSGKSHTFVVKNAAGDTLTQTCIPVGPSPDAVAAHAAANSDDGATGTAISAETIVVGSEAPCAA